MKRTAFLKLALITGWLANLPLIGFARNKASARVNGGFLVSAGTDRRKKPISPFKGDQFFCKVSGKDNDGDMYVFESTRTNDGGPILHTHFDQDEFWYVLEGDFLIRVGDVTYTAKKGDFVYGPRRVPHTFSKVGAGIGRVLIGFQPAGRMEEYFQKLNDGVAKDMTDEQREAMRKEHGFESSGPAIGELKK